LPALTRNATQERTVVLMRLLAYGAFLVPLILVVIVFDYAKIRVVVEDRRSVVVALLAAIRFVVKRAGQVWALFALNGLALIVVLLLYYLVAPGVGSAGWSMVWAFAIGQLYIAARGWVKLLAWSSQIALFQGNLAHAAYVRRPLPTWPESASIEAIRS
jgi:hypothetical protein